MRKLAFTLCLFSLTACKVTDMRLWQCVGTPGAEACEVAQLRDVAYIDGAGKKQKLDLVLPKGEKDYPVVFLVHGGAWILGDNRSCGLYTSVAEALARQGIGVVLPNYRLSPGVKHPEHIKDVARAFAWTKSNIAEHGGDPRKIYLVGHSAGGHLVALLATDDSYLKAYGCDLSDIKGVVGVSGVYRIPEGKADVSLGGITPVAVRLDEFTPLRGNGMKKGPRLADLGGVPLSVNIFAPAFGDDPRVRQHASPVNHVKPGLPPFLIMNAEKDLPLLPDMSNEFRDVMEKNGCVCRHMTVENRNHNSILFKAAEPSDPVGRAIVEFVRK